MNFKPTHIIIHCSATSDSGTVSWQAIRRYHTQYLGWSDIGYHYGIELVNDAYDILVGRMLTVPGAHCRAGGMNMKSIGVCVVGDFDLAEPKPLQIGLAKKLVRSLQQIFRVPAVNVLGHREVESRKTCPGAMFDMRAFREAL
ncbi:N-acetylmuramoyl-L-alanine amidase [Desulfosarcina widdelii]|uniref:N-acetylmuramoyl-L-alanine amidase n=1 Tax=Desulfosarcina widdelii TaxID=947919 RepID=A0A5K7ZES7_9BACT|nr:peptidoglycan recognition family protein [Desulfosarcina widdelii]BBO74697.1 N-acetylmuramoyl-L-alanine amidase [Desulfosarcina widdelii]